MIPLTRRGIIHVTQTGQGIPSGMKVLCSVFTELCAANGPIRSYLWNEQPLSSVRRCSRRDYTVLRSVPIQVEGLGVPSTTLCAPFSIQGRPPSDKDFWHSLSFWRSYASRKRVRYVDGLLQIDLVYHRRAKVEHLFRRPCRDVPFGF